jgi:hypothetical protein
MLSDTLMVARIIGILASCVALFEGFVVHEG